MMNFDNFFEEVFNDDNFNIIDTETIYNALIEIFEHKGFDKQLTNLTLACLDFIALKNIYDAEKGNPLKQADIYNRMIKTMAVINVLIETFIVADDNVFDMVEDFREEYINNELNRIEFEKNTSTSNRIAKYLKNNGDLDE